MAEVMLREGPAVVTVYEAKETRPVRPRPLEVLEDIAGERAVYMGTATLEEVPVSGRLLVKADVAQVELWTASGAAVELIERDGSVSTGWSIHTSPPPNIRRKDGNSADWLIDCRLWRNS